MRVILVLLPLLSAIALVTATASPQPGAGVSQPIHKLKQVSRRELVARAKYSEHFFVEKRQEPSGEPEPPSPCEGFRGSRRRDLDATYDQVLGPREVVAFLKGRGQFVSENGTVTYIRHEDVDEIERLLLDDPDFTDIELSGIRITRSFLEAALAY
ncbi:hypothetical protein NMY22_g10864 [Coprinellus aureogranulatus]|nr:hypothetical protein NMY22_g10864 [Coprinellus aureogranulatus]